MVHIQGVVCLLSKQKLCSLSTNIQYDWLKDLWFVDEYNYVFLKTVIWIWACPNLLGP